MAGLRALGQLLLALVLLHAWGIEPGADRLLLQTLLRASVIDGYSAEQVVAPGCSPLQEVVTGAGGALTITCACQGMPSPVTVCHRLSKLLVVLVFPS